MSWTIVYLQTNRNYKLYRLNRNLHQKTKKTYKPENNAKQIQQFITKYLQLHVNHNIHILQVFTIQKIQMTGLRNRALGD